MQHENVYCDAIFMSLYRQGPSALTTADSRFWYSFQEDPAHSMIQKNYD